jgi:carbonyl reductase 1
LTSTRVCVCEKLLDSGTGMSLRRIVVTGGNSGIGFALCKQLALEDGCFVYLGARSLSKAEEAVALLLASSPSLAGRLAPLAVDPGFDETVRAAAASLVGLELYAVVNNAGTGLGHKTAPEEVLNVNAVGPKRVTEAFLPLLAPGGRVVNVGSGAAGSFVKSQPPEVQKLLCSPPASWDRLEALLAVKKTDEAFMKDPWGPYGLSKAVLAAYTMLAAKAAPSILFSCVSPGFIATRMTAGLGASKPPEEGTASIRHALFAPLAGNGWYYGSDAIRSPYHFMRNPGEPAYDGVPPY